MCSKRLASVKTGQYQPPEELQRFLKYIIPKELTFEGGIFQIEKLFLEV